jgi:hypothetical protein
MSRKSWWLDAAVVFALASILVLPLFDERSLRNWPHYLWQPLCSNGAVIFTNDPQGKSVRTMSTPSSRAVSQRLRVTATL